MTTKQNIEDSTHLCNVLITETLAIEIALEIAMKNRIIQRLEKIRREHPEFAVNTDALIQERAVRILDLEQMRDRALELAGTGTLEEYRPIYERMALEVELDQIFDGFVWPPDE